MQYQVKLEEFVGRRNRYTFDGSLIGEEGLNKALFLYHDDQWIGEISPFVDWVKDGDIIDVSNLAFGRYDEDRPELIKFSRVAFFEGLIQMCRTKKWCVKVRGSCNHFH